MGLPEDVVIYMFVDMGYGLCGCVLYVFVVCFDCIHIRICVYMQVHVCRWYTGTSMPIQVCVWK